MHQPDRRPLGAGRVVIVGRQGAPATSSRPIQPGADDLCGAVGVLTSGEEVVGAGQSPERLGLGGRLEDPLSLGDGDDVVVGGVDHEQWPSETGDRPGLVVAVEIVEEVGADRERPTADLDHCLALAAYPVLVAGEQGTDVARRARGTEGGDRSHGLQPVGGEQGRGAAEAVPDERTRPVAAFEEATVARVRSPTWTETVESVNSPPESPRPVKSNRSTA